MTSQYISKWIIISISGCSVLLYIFAFIATFLVKFNSIRSLVSLQLIFTCLCQSIAFLLSSDSFCVLQTFFNSFGELGKLSVSMTMMVMSVIIFNEEMQSKIKRLFLIVSMALSWAIPLVVCSLCVLLGGARKYSEFCWIDSKEEMYAYAGIRLVIIAIAIGISMALFKKVKKLNGNSDKDYVIFEKRMILFCVVLDLMCLIYIAFTVINFLSSFGIELNFLFPFIDVINSLSSCVLVIVFVFTKEKINFLLKKICCKDTNDKDDDNLIVYLAETE